DLPDAGEGLVDAGVAAVDQLDGPESAHPGAGVLEAEREGAGDLALRPGQLELLDTRLAHAAELLGQQLDDLARAAGTAGGVHAEQSRIAVAGAEGVDGVGQPPLLADGLEQARGHAAAEHGHEHREGVAVLAERGETLPAEVD